MGLRGFARAVLAGALACVLSACWMSEKPLITAKVAETVPFTGTYTGSGDEGPEKLIVKALEGRSYELNSGKDDRIPAEFVALGGDWYLMQGEGHSDEEGTPPFYLYQLVRPVNGDLNFYSPTCEEISGKFKGMKREKGQIETCLFSRLDGLKSGARAWIAKLGKGEVPNEPAVFKRAATSLPHG